MFGRKAKRHYIYGRLFLFSEFPEIERCHNEWRRLVNKCYDLDDDLEGGKITEERWEKENEVLTSMADEFEINVYAKAVHDEFYGKGIVIQERETKKEVPFDEVFNGKFDDLSLDQRNMLTAIIEVDGTYKLPAEYYDKKKKRY